MKKKIKDLTILELLKIRCGDVGPSCSKCIFGGSMDNSLGDRLCDLFNCESSNDPILDLEVEVKE